LFSQMHMKKCNIILTLLFELTFSCFQVYAVDVLKQVNPFIGTSNSKQLTRWGAEGGTYPGAVAPFGFVQLTPETRAGDANGYDYRDSLIYCFSCVNHHSGYPGGSGGNIKIMPLSGSGKKKITGFGRPFSHQKEKAEAGYYRVGFSDNHTLAEVTASERTGMFRFTFPAQVRPQIFIGNMGHIDTKSKRIIQGSAFNTVVLLNADFIDREDVDDGCILSFPVKNNGENVILMKIGVSTVDFKSSLRNLDVELGTWDFDLFRSKNQQKWDDLLATIEVEDHSETNQSIFYSALYHSLLLPWIISDVDGFYRGSDRKIQQTKGKNQYGAFSPWDTFRSLHPLLCLVAPERQNDMIRSMLDQFGQTGKLPKGPMTGYHSIPVIVDSYQKGIRNFDSTLAYNAMKASLDSCAGDPDFVDYLRSGFVSISHSESVTKTVEFAYNDWALAQLAEIVKDTTGYRRFQQRGFNYRHLLHPESMFLVPRRANQYIPEPESLGYKEGDKWIYSMFVPHNPLDLVNLMGGDKTFTLRLDSALSDQSIIFDNEPALHVPYLFNFSQSPFLSQKWVREFMRTNYSNSVDGLPGNDDLGSMSSWYVFSAMGFYPFCPGRPIYELGSPIFEKVTLHLASGKKFTVKSINNSEQNFYVKKVKMNDSDYPKLWLSHAAILNGGELVFEMDSAPALQAFSRVDFSGRSETPEASAISVESFSFSSGKVTPGQDFSIRFTLQNRGSDGTKTIRLYVDGKEYARKNVWVKGQSVKQDSLECRLYPLGMRKIRIDNLDEKLVLVSDSGYRQLKRSQASRISCPPVFRKQTSPVYQYWVQNISGYRDSSAFQVFLNDSLIQEDWVGTNPGELKKIEHQLNVPDAGIYSLKVDKVSTRIKVYDSNAGSGIIDISMNNRIGRDTIPDSSGLGNHGILVQGEEPVNNPKFIEFKPARSLDQMQDKITVMAWIFPARQQGMADIITKGDYIVFQQDNRSLTFFAGGWGQGTCTVPLPENWENNWHHIAGICNHRKLQIFMDGKEAGTFMLDKPVNLSSRAKWMIGRNDEFPDQRFFNGKVDHFKVFAEPLTGSEIRLEMKK